ncbi:hypothetical protein KL948_002228 [Ogataea haglerorum]|uniref:uncharacterized protein n=1 Tax=Ogataea haglerorum TaxID=1937702 RepID=UPI001C89242B|nr:uncharacterized protein KL911_002270 [Ogataea haglerorum]KAG7697122.1 hypothetical protein KL915_002385 [Ogataea haglerorum]KAG7709829.1 hypothetical protein KL950_002048 [Ogataea haglerorum]KAG7732030.1 hypothetical protein KL948_002228 [Ogataea haglerorum]KAG7748774.1 hypothetical protein KL912_001836 [Ogataea haglerorum]KAG7754831.1 hypothetical protein KL911_002270 [Ogataea haglerorum]
MSELTAAEKRRLLRERRQAKLAATSSDRLGKITGTVGSHLPTASPLSAEDPPVSDISEATTPAIDGSSGDSEPSMDKILESMLSQGHNHNVPSLLPDDFMKTMSSILPSTNDESTEPTPGPESNASEHEMQLNEYNRYQLRKFRLGFTALRFVSVLTLVYFKLVGYTLFYPSFERLDHGYGKIDLWNWFTILEVIFSVVYVLVYRFLPRTKENSIFSIIEGILPQRYRSRFEMIVKYRDVIAFWINDLSVLILALGCLAWLNN